VGAVVANDRARLRTGRIFSDSFSQANPSSLRTTKEFQMSLHDKRVVVTGGSRGLGLGIVEALVDQGTKIWVVARPSPSLDALTALPGVEIAPADITDAEAARAILADVRPDILILNAGAKPRMAALDTASWEDFSATWDTDVRGGLYWLQAALNLPLAPGSRVLVSSSGAALQGSAMSGGYGGAKWMLWLMTKYAQSVSDEKSLGIDFQTIVPQQMVAGTGVGGAGAAAYAQSNGISVEAYLQRYPEMPPRAFGDHVVRILTDTSYDAGLALGIRGDTGVTILKEKAA